MTGSGKTAAFVLPIVQQLMRRRGRATRALVLTPTRELAAQITEHIDAMAYHTSITCASVFGGVAMGPQEKAFRRGADIIVATPGRLLDHFQHSYAKLQSLEILVLDEADRMLDMGFLPDVRRILRHVPQAKQTLFFSATLPPPIVKLSKDMLNKPVTVNTDRVSAPAAGISQAVYMTRSELKSDLLLELLNRESIKNVLVFTRTKHRANRLAKFLERNGVACERIHGNRSQSQRTDALAGFKSGQFRVLVATDIAARGIDIEALSHVINFDVPDVPESYIHRVGRTARASLTGDALTLVCAAEEAALRDIERTLGKPLPRLRLKGFDYAAKGTSRTDSGRRGPSRSQRKHYSPGKKVQGAKRGSGVSRNSGAPSRKRSAPKSRVQFATKSSSSDTSASTYGRRSRPAPRKARRPR
jgi:ATP-dependent RNA helicase RhlE